MKDTKSKEFLSKLGDNSRFHVELCCTGSNVAHKVQRYIDLFVASELVSDVDEFILASSPRGLRSKTGGPNKSVHRRGRSGGVVNSKSATTPPKHTESENQYSFVVKQFCASTGVLVPDPFSLDTYSCLPRRHRRAKRQRAERLNPRKDCREREGERKRLISRAIPDRGHDTYFSRELSPWRLV